MITNKDLEIMIKIENLVGKLNKEIFGENGDKKVIVNWFDNTKTIITLKDFEDYIGVVEKIINDKKKCAEKVNKYNKEHKEYHKIINNISNARKSGNIEKLAYWESKLEDYKSFKNSLKNK